MIEVSGMGANPSRTLIITTYADSESRILTLGHPHKHCRTSLLHELGSGNPLVLQAKKTSIVSSQLSGLRNLLWNVCWWNRSFLQNSFLQQDCACFLIKSWVLWVMAHFNTCISLTHPWSYYCSIFQHYISFKPSSTSFLHTLGVTIITKTKLQLIFPNTDKYCQKNALVHP